MSDESSETRYNKKIIVQTKTIYRLEDMGGPELPSNNEGTVKLPAFPTPFLHSLKINRFSGFGKLSNKLTTHTFMELTFP